MEKQSYIAWISLTENKQNRVHGLKNGLKVGQLLSITSTKVYGIPWMFSRSQTFSFNKTSFCFVLFMTEIFRFTKISQLPNIFIQSLRARDNYWYLVALRVTLSVLSSKNFGTLYSSENSNTGMTKDLASSNFLSSSPKVGHNNKLEHLSLSGFSRGLYHKTYYDREPTRS